MSTNSLGRTARQSVKILQRQLAWIVAMALIGAIAFDARAGWSVLAGGGIVILWTAYMAFTLYRHSVNRGAQLGMATFMIAWLVKMAFTIGLLVVAFRSRALAPLGLMAGLFGALVAYWVCLAFGSSRHKSTAGGGSGAKG